MFSGFAAICRCLQSPQVGFRCLLALFVVFGSFEQGAGCCCTRAIAAAAEQLQPDPAADRCCPKSTAPESSCCQTSRQTPRTSTCCVTTAVRTEFRSSARCCACCSPDAPRNPRVPEPKSPDNDRSKSPGSSAGMVPAAMAVGQPPALVKPVLAVLHERALLSHNQTQSLLCVWRN